MSTPVDIRKILFIAPPLLCERVDFYPDFPTPPLGMAYVCSNTGDDLQKDILDLSFYNDWDEIRTDLERADDYDLYAFTAMTPLYDSALSVARILRKKREGIFVIGGSHASVMPREVLDSGSFDIAIIGEGEKTFRELISTIRSGGDLSSIGGIAFKNGIGEFVVTKRDEFINDLDSLSFPARELLPMNSYINQFKEVTGEEGVTLLCSRGCPYNCAFCSKEIFGDKFRVRSAKNVVEEIKDLIKNYGVDMFQFVDDTFTINHQFVSELCDEIRRSKLNIRWQCESRVNTVNAELISKMKRAGCIRIMYGVESGDQGLLDSMNKGITIDQVVNAFEITRKENVSTGAFIMIGYPGETEETLEKTVQIIKRIKPDLISVSFANILPGTLMQREYGETDIADSAEFYDYHIRSNLNSDESMNKKKLEARDQIFDFMKARA
ncbi:MAG: radical SAM protein [Thermodesulfobacteriota bacterium]